MLDAKRSLGQYSTPIDTVNYMVERLLSILPPKDDSRILDPAVGDGIFVQSLIDHGINPDDIDAFDIDEGVVGRFQTGSYPVKVRHQDFLTSSADGYDAIIGNPPYKSKRESDYIKQRRPHLEDQFKLTGIQNMYAMFVVHALRHLREGGVLCFIVQDSFLTNVYYRNFRKYLLDNSIIHEITLAPRRLFHQKNADVRTAIILLEKCTGEENAETRRNHRMKLVDRLAVESDYYHPPQDKLQYIEQQAFVVMENYNFFINIPRRVIEIVRDSVLRLGDVIEGGTGISTGNDARFLRKVTTDASTDTTTLSLGGLATTDMASLAAEEEVQTRTEAAADAETEESTDSEAAQGEGDSWVPFYKNGGFRDAWYYETPYRIREDWQTAASKYKDFIARNADYYFREGITCSSMGIEFSAAYLPSGCLFGVNANLFAASQTQLFYVLGLLNSLLMKYLVRAVYNRTNMVTAGYIKRLPYIEPVASVKEKIAALSQTIVKKKRANASFDPAPLEATINSLVFETYGIAPSDVLQIQRFCANMFESL